jgi:hypothetical protein
MEREQLRKRLEEIASAGWEKAPVHAGVYAVVNAQTLRVYVGASSNLSARLSQHKCRIFGGLHTNGRLSEDVAIYGPDSFSGGVLAVCDVETAFGLESKLIRSLAIEERYNVVQSLGGVPANDGAGGGTPAERQDAHRERLHRKGLHEVRGIWLPEELHEAFKEYVRTSGEYDDPEASGSPRASISA